MRIIGLAPNPWHGQWVNRQHLLSRLGRRHHVLYSTGAWSVWDRHSPEWRVTAASGSLGIADGVHVEVAPKYLLRWPRWRSYDRLAIKLHARRLLSFGPREQAGRVTIAFHPSFQPYVSALNADCTVYHAYDLFDAIPGWTDADETLERSLLRQAHLVTAVSPGIVTRLQEKGAREVRLLPNGVDLAAFEAVRNSTAVEPPELASIPRPRLGYIGSLHPQVDYELLTVLARRRPDWHFVMIGPRIRVQDERAEKDIRLCEQCPNVHWLGDRHHTQIPLLAAHIDVHLMTYRLADRTWIHGIYPLKLHEYLATGKPVVSADIPSVRAFRHVVRIASGADEWHQAISEALESGGSGTETKRKAVAAANTWDARVADLTAWIAPLIGTPPGQRP